jgi:5-carboxymethyl-2-hydroxymuconic-semialdehyde dehydrogenase
MQIHHLINGAAVPGTDYFETVNPATQEVLAEVARGGAREIDAAVAAAKSAFPAWAGRPAVERAVLLRKLGAVHDVDLEGRAGPRIRQYRRPQDERAVAALGRAPGGIGT